MGDLNPLVQVTEVFSMDLLHTTFTGEIENTPIRGAGGLYSHCRWTQRPWIDTISEFPDKTSK